MLLVAAGQAQVGGAPLFAPSGSGVQWEWREFGNAARNDGLVLKRWCRKGQPIAEYPFAAFNKKAAILKYSPEEYAKYLTVEDWDKKETDDLLSMAEKFSLNFVVIADRWPHATPRTTDQLKDRFYLTQRKLAEVKGLGVDGENEGVLLGHPFNKEWEMERKDHLLKLMQRSKAEEREDQAVQEKARKIDEQLRKTRKADLKKKKVDTEERDEPLCPVGMPVVRSNMVSKRAEKAGVLKWLHTSGTPATLSSRNTQHVYTALCNNIIELLDWQKQVARKRRERESEYNKKQELVRPLKKRKAAPNLKFSDSPAAGAPVGLPGNVPAAAPPVAAPRSAGGQPRVPGSGQFAPAEGGPAPQKKRKH